jgi:hypothetical protein
VDKFCDGSWSIEKVRFIGYFKQVAYCKRCVENRI